MKYCHLLPAILTLLLSSPCLGDVVLVQDDFDGTELSPDWVIHLDLPPTAAGWTYAVAAGSLTVTDVQPDSVGVWSAVRVRQECDAVGEFDLEASFAWDTTSEPQTNHAMQLVGVCLLDALGDLVGGVWYYDCWFSSRGTRLARVGSETEEDPPSSLPYEGLATVSIERVADVVSVYWDSQLMISETETAAVSLVELSFWYFCHVSGSFFGTESIDYITVTAPETPVEPRSWSQIKALYRS